MKIQPYKTLKSYNELELKERKSIFLAKAYPVSSEDEVNSILNDLKKKYYDASHRCYAYLLMSGKSKFSDAGEPSGSAGIRILNAIDHFELQNCLVVVIRYFGGTKLGIGPLGKAYYSAVIQVLTKSEIITKNPYLEARIIFATASFNKISSFLNSNHIKVLETLYDSEISLKCLISYELVEKMKVKITELLKGNVIFHTSDGIIFK
jgi:uncharacterized YigZ family protein